MKARTLPLVGRAEELRVAIACFETPGGGIVFAGDIGVGKSHLADEVLRVLEGNGRRVVRLVATSAMQRIAFGVFAPFVHSDPDAAPDGLDALQRVRDAVVRTEEPPVVVGIDDAHLLDEHSIAFLQQIVRRGEASLVATYRTNEHVAPSLSDLWKERYVERIELQPLAESDAAELVRAVVGPVDEVALRLLWLRSDGNPLYLRELLEAIAAVDGFANRDGILSVEAMPPPTAVLTELVETRLEALAPEHRAALEALAVAESLGLAHAEALGILDSLSDLERGALIRVDADGARTTVRMGHPIYGEVLRVRVGSLRRRVIAGRLAEAQATIGMRRRDDILRLALWQLESGATRDPDVLLAAARQAWARVDPASRERLSRAAVEAGAGPDAAYELADALWWLGRVDDSLEALELADVPDATAATRVRAQTHRATCLFLGRGDFDGAERQLQSTVAQFFDDAALRGSALGQLAQLLTFRGRLDESIELAFSILGDPAYDVGARLRAYSGLIAALAICGRFTDVDRDAAPALAAAAERASESPTAAGGILVGQCIRWYLDGRTAEIDAVLATMPAPSVPGADPLRGIWLLLRGRSALAAGRCADAVTSLRAAAVALAQLDPGRLRAWCAAALAQALAQVGDAPGAAAAATEAHAFGIPHVEVYSIEVDLADAWATMAAGRATEARAMLVGAADGALERRHYGAARLAYQEAARIGAGDPATAGIDRCNEEIGGDYGAVIANFAGALATKDPERLARAGEGFASASAWLLAAEAMAAAAARYAEEGMHGAAARCASLAEIWRRSCGTVVTPLLATLDGGATAVLSARELEVAQLARLGLVNREIAERLFISARTVGNHLNHVYVKLGLSSRAELRSYLERREI